MEATLTDEELETALSDADENFWAMLSEQWDLDLSNIQYVHNDPSFLEDNLVQYDVPMLQMTGRHRADPASLFTSTSPASFIHSAAMSPVSLFGSPASFMTASSPASFMTARSTYPSPAMGLVNGPSPVIRIQTIREDEPPEPYIPAPLQKLRNEYYEQLHQRQIVQPFDKELNWSGKGQHVAFLPKESVPLTVLSHLGASITASVDKVLCRRIAIARKVMRCSRQWTIADALREVYHLQNLRHAHIVQLVGSYLQGRNFAILMYPVADCHLGTFMEDTSDLDESDGEYEPRRTFLNKSIGCLASAMSYIHHQTTKHMDIKPQNILVKNVSPNVYSWAVYLADFGLSRTFTSQDHSQTDGPTSRTPRYCAPEVFHYQKRGRSADTFSLGCVFLEMLNTYIGIHPQDFADFRRGESNDESFHANLPRVMEWIDKRFTQEHDNSCALILPKVRFVREMLHSEPSKRPAPLQIVDSWFSYSLFNCCNRPPEPYVAYQNAPEPSSPLKAEAIMNSPPPKHDEVFSPARSLETSLNPDEVREHGEATTSQQDDRLAQLPHLHQAQAIHANAREATKTTRKRTRSFHSEEPKRTGLPPSWTTGSADPR